ATDHRAQRRGARAGATTSTADPQKWCHGTCRALVPAPPPLRRHRVGAATLPRAWRACSGLPPAYALTLEAPTSAPEQPRRPHHARAPRKRVSATPRGTPTARSEYSVWLRGQLKATIEGR